MQQADVLAGLLSAHAAALSHGTAAFAWLPPHGTARWTK